MMQPNLRPELARHLRQRVDAFGEGFRHNLALIGPPGSGKTFQLHELLAQPPSHSILVYCPLYRESCRTFLNRFLCAILEAGLNVSSRQAAPHVLEGPGRTLDALLQRAEVALPATASAVRYVEPLIARRNYGEAFCRALDTVPVLTGERQQSCVLLLDEFLHLEELGLHHAFHELGKRVMTWPSTLFVLTSSSSFRARAILRERLHLLFGQFELLTLDAPDVAVAKAWADRELKGIRRVSSFSPFLVQWLGAYPWYLAVVLKRLKELAALGRTREVTEALFLETMWDMLGSPEGTLHQWCVSRTAGLGQSRAGARALEALLQMAQGVRTATELGKRIGRAGLSGALQLLIEHDLAQRNGMCWMVTDPIIRCWSSTVVAAQRSDARIEPAEVKRRFERAVRGLWSDWSQAHQLSFPQQVVALFEKFREETVSLDSKTGRLPRFTAIRTEPSAEPDAQGYLVAEGDGKRWCAAVRQGQVTEAEISTFDAFCRSQHPKPSRKVVVTQGGLDQNAKLLAKTVNMWVWEAEDLQLLKGLYGC